jgi:hypothetical protein
METDEPNGVSVPQALLRGLEGASSPAAAYLEHEVQQRLSGWGVDAEQPELSAGALLYLQSITGTAMPGHATAGHEKQAGLRGAHNSSSKNQIWQSEVSAVQGVVVHQRRSLCTDRFIRGRGSHCVIVRVLALREHALYRPRYYGRMPERVLSSLAIIGH